jgi:hypothetical protein
MCHINLERSWIVKRTETRLWLLYGSRRAIQRPIVVRPFKLYPPALTRNPCASLFIRQIPDHKVE